MAKSLPPATRAGKSLSEDLIGEILLRLPVKILLRCKSVSKIWKALISSPEFVKSHLLCTIASPGADETLIIHNYSISDVGVRSISLFNVNSGNFVADLNLPYLENEFTFVPKTCLVGSACGIVCVCGCFDYYEFRTYIRESPIDCTYLWNPATKQSLRIPQHTIDVKSKHWIIGFGFDHVSNDFKVVRMVLDPFCAAEVYSTNRNSWRKVEHVENDSIDVLIPNDIFVCVKGYMCCTNNTFNEDKDTIFSHMIAFDLNKEVLSCAIELPVESELTRITEFNDSIAVVGWGEIGGISKIKLWKLEDETCLRVGGVEASWTLMLNIDHYVEVERVYGYLNNGNFLISLGEDSCFVFGTNVDKYVPRCVYPAQLFKYKESLVTFPGSKLVDRSARGMKV